MSDEYADMQIDERDDRIATLERELAEAREANQRQAVIIACLQLRIRDALAALNRDVCLA